MKFLRKLKRLEIWADPARRKRAILLTLIALVFLAVAAGIASLAWAYFEVFIPLDRVSERHVEFAVEKGKGVKEIAAQLEKQNLIRSAFWFEVYVWYKGQGSNLQAGKYLLNPGYSAYEISSLITGGKVIKNEAMVTIPEGYTLKQIQDRMNEQGVPAGIDLVNEKTSDYEVQYKFLSGAPQGSGLEGFMFPDTYIFNKEIKKEELVKKFLDNFDKKLTPAMRESISKQNKSVYETLVLASIVQAEAINDAEMPMIASVFMNRLKKGMPLQSDATVNYVTGKNMRQISLDDTKLKTPYNTYLNKGLPPGPIGNPGIAAIKAVISPATSDYYYFLHPKDSAAIFSKTADEHLRNKAKYLK